jgi:hypothetical protein
MGILVELNEHGDIKTLWTATAESIKAAKARFDELINNGNIMYQVGEHDDINTCKRCASTVAEIAPAPEPKPDPNAIGTKVTVLNEKACEVVAVKRTVGG